MQVERKTLNQNLSLLVLLLITAIISAFLIRSLGNTNEAINTIKFKQAKSLLYVDELRQSSDDLTKMARLYVITQDTIYLDYFNEILKIRDGIVKRPINYADIYWDYMLADGQIPRPGTEAKPLVELMMESSLSKEASSYFIKAKNNSDDLVAIEEEAFNAMLGVFKDSLGDYSVKSQPNAEFAIELLHNRSYHLAKAKIMKSIQDFNNFIQYYAENQISSLDQKYNRSIRALFFIILFATIEIVFIIFLLIRRHRGLPERSKEDKKEYNYSLKNIVREIKKAWILSMASVLFSILIVAGFISAGHIIKEEINTNLEQSLNTILETTQAAILNWMNDVELSMEQLFHSNNLQTDIQNTINNINTNRSADLERRLRQIFSHLSYYGYFISGENGQIIVSNFEGFIDKNIAELDDDYFVRTLQLPEFNIVNSLPKGSGSDHMYNSLIKFGHSYFSDEGDYKGSFIIMMDPQKRFTNVLQGGRMGISGESYAFNRYGEMISESRFDNDLYDIGLLEDGKNSLLNILIKDPGGDMTNGFIPPLEREEQQYTVMASNALKGLEGINTDGYNDYRGVKVVGVWKWVEKYGFGITTEIDHKEAFRTYYLIINLGLYSLIFIIGLIFTLTTIFILNRLKQSSLSQRIERQKVLLENTLESLTHPFYVIDANDYSLLLANSAAKRLGKSETSHCYALTHKRSEPCDSKDDPCPLKIVKETKKPVVLEHTHFDAKGEPRIVEVAGYPIFNKNGDVVQMIEYSIDITDRKKAENEIKASENKFRSITSTASDAIISADEKGQIVSWNKAAESIFGYLEDEVKGKALEVIIPEKYRKDHQDGIQRLLKGGKKNIIGKVVELEGLRKNGDTFPIELSLSAWKVQEGMNFSGIIRDITERKKIEKILVDAKKRMEDELNVAKDIQMSMLPLIFPAFPQRAEIDVYAHLIPAREVGGDFYDFYFLDENHFCFVVGDVSGKGVPAALMMAVTKTLLKSRAGNDKSTASILTHVNNEIAKDNDAYMFITVFIAILNTNTGELVYSNAGHNPSYILSPGDKAPQKLADLSGPVIGAMEQMSYSESRVFIDKDDMVVAYTDGVTEAQNLNDELYSDERFAEFLQNWPFTTTEKLVDDIIRSVKEHENGAEQFDDITTLVVQYCQLPDSVYSDHISFKIVNKIQEIETATSHFEEFCEKNNISIPIVQKFNIAFDELLNNIINYGYKDEQVHEIDVEVVIRGDRMIISISDDGIPFNPFTQDPPDTMLSVEERGIGGIGIHIVKNLMDEYSYKRNIDKNVITLVKHNVNE